MGFHLKRGFFNYLFSLLLCAGFGTGNALSQPCFLKPAPGFWSAEGQWLSADKDCLLHNLAGSQGVSAELPNSEAATILLFGGSNDNDVLEDLWLEQASHAHGTEVFRSCLHDSFSVSNQPMVRWACGLNVRQR